MGFRQTNSRGIVFILSVVLSVFVLFPAGCSKKTPQESEKDSTAQETAKTPWRSSLNDVINRRSQWNPVLTNWYEKKLSDFSVIDLNGKKHKLSDYQGKNVIIVLWATWCQPCIQEVPHLMALQNIIERDNLSMQILAISNENIDKIKAFKEKYNINYTLISSLNAALPKPLNSIEFVPSSVFIDPNGKIKLIAQGSAYLSEIKAIALAE